MQMHVPSDEGSVSQVMTDAERAAVIADGQDPNDLADWLAQFADDYMSEDISDARRIAQAAALLRQQAEQLDHYRANYTQTCGELFHLTAERDEYRRQLDTLHNAESVGVNYCTIHHGIANEDDRRCDSADDDDEWDENSEPRPCVMVNLIQRPALAAAGGGVPEEGAADG